MRLNGQLGDDVFELSKMEESARRALAESYLNSLIFGIDYDQPRFNQVSRSLCFSYVLNIYLQIETVTSYHRAII